MAAGDDLPPAPAAAAVARQPLPPPRPQPALPPLDPPDRARGRLDAALGVVVLALALLLASFPARNSDVWLHLAAGRLLAAREYRFGADPFAHTSAGAYWVNHSWLYDLLGYAGYQALGGGGLVALKALAVAALAGLLLVLGRLSAAGPKRPRLWVPAACAGLALLALGPRLALQPVCVSYLFLALTLWILDRPRRTAAAVALTSYWPLLPLFALWVNLDAWFFLGPLTVGLSWLGAVAAGGGRRPGEARALGLAFAAGLAACLLNPHHVRAFTLPPELTFAGAAPEDPLLQGLVLSPFTAAYFRSGLGPAGLAYYLLALLGVLSFALNYRAWPWARALVWLALFGLSAWQARAIPFFAVAAAPAAARNLQEFAARLVGAAPDRWAEARRWAVGLRVLTLFGGVALLAAAWPGWLQAPPYEARGWAAEPDPSLPPAAAQLGHWRREGQLAADDLGFNFAPDTANYFAWACPEEKSFLDGRLALFPGDARADYLAVRRALLVGAAGPPGDDDWRDVLRRRHVNHLVLYDNDYQRLTSPLRALLADPEEWPLLYLEGRAAVFAWRDPAAPAGADRLAGLRLDLDQLAFHPPEEKKAPLEWPGRGPRPSQGGAVPFPSAAAAAHSADRDAAATHLLHFEALRPRQLRRHTAAWEGGLVASFVGAAAPGASPAPTLDFCLRVRLAGAQPRPKPGQPGAPPDALDDLALRLRQGYLVRQDEAPPGLLLLAVRAARRALHDNPDDAGAYLLLGEVYARLAGATRERVWGTALPHLSTLRRVQASTAFNQALLLKPDLVPAHAGLATLYQQLGYFDLALRHLKEQLKYTRSAGRQPGETAEQFAGRLATLEEYVAARDKEVQQQLDLYEVRAANLKVLDRAKFADSRGLSGKALEVLLGSDYAAFGPQGMLIELQLLLTTGRVQEVRAWTDPEQQEAVGEYAYHWLQAQLAAATGDYRRADAAAAVLAATGGPPRPVLALAVGQAVLEAAPAPPGAANPVHGLFGRLRLRDGLAAVAVLRQQADLTVLRGLLALEAGESAEAEGYFREALAVWGGATAVPGAGIDFDARPVAQDCLELLTGGRGP